MTFRDVVTSNRRTWTATEERVLAVLLAPEASADLTITAVARRADAHKSTVVRVAQHLGYTGYAALRRDLHTEKAVAETTAWKELDNDAVVPAPDIDALTALNYTVSRDVLAGAARALHDSDDIVLFAKHDDAPLRDLLAQRLRRLGKTTHILGSSAKDIAERLHSLSHDATLVAFALRKPSRYLPDLIAETSRRGASSILITDGSGSPFHPSAHHVLALSRSDPQDLAADLVPMALCYALQRAVIHLDPATYANISSGINELTHTLGGSRDIISRTEK